MTAAKAPPFRRKKSTTTMTRGEKVIAFIEEFCKVPEGKLVGQPLKLAPFQISFILDVYDNPHGTSTAILCMARKNAKALALDTPIPTPSGWTTMGELQEGDYVLGSDGKPTRVVLATDVMHDHTCYEVLFTDGERIIADAGHQWAVRWTGRSGRNGFDPERLVTRTTQDMVDGPYPPESAGKTYPWAVPVAKPLVGRRAALPIPPYTLGAWLGDGISDGATLCLGQRDAGHILGRVIEEGWPARVTRQDRGVSYVSLSDGVMNRGKDFCPLQELRRHGLLGNKHIPREYQRASLAQRRALLQGLMDTDGYVSKVGQATYSTSSPVLRDDVYELALGLGFKATIMESTAKIGDKEYGLCWNVQFWPLQEDKIVTVPFKSERVRTEVKGSRTQFKAIVSITPVPSVPVRCIMVSAADSLFLCGRQFTVTHNTATIACLLLAHICGPEAVQNSQIVSGAMSREQASLVFRLSCKMIRLDPRLAAVTRIVPSTKEIFGLGLSVEYKALSAEATTAHGLSPVLAILDEVGQIKGPTSPFVEAITSAQGAYDNPLLIAISTSAASDADMLSVWIDDAKRSGDPHIVVHEYRADEKCDLLDKTQWRKANPALGLFRSQQDLERQLTKASRLPALEASARNLLLNQRISQIALWLAPTPWKECNGAPDLEVFKRSQVAIGLDLSARLDLTAAVIAAADENGVVHTIPFVFTPEVGLKDREDRDKAPYTAWVRDGLMFTTPGRSVDYNWVAGFLKIQMDKMGIVLSYLCFDRWRIAQFRLAADATGFAQEAVWIEVGQGYQSMSPRMTAFEHCLLSGKLRHGAHPLLNMAAANCIATKDPAGNQKPDKSKSTQRIDPLVGCVMAVFEVTEGATLGVDVGAMVG